MRTTKFISLFEWLVYISNCCYDIKPTYFLSLLVRSIDFSNGWRLEYLYCIKIVLIDKNSGSLNATKLLCTKISGMLP